MELFKHNKFKVVKIFLAALMAFALGILFAWWSFMLDEENLDFSCSANIIHVNEKDGIEMKTIAHFIFKPGGKGIVTLDGEVKDGNKSFYLSRTMSLEYEHFGKNVYYIKDNTPKINEKDSLPEKIFEKKFLSSSYFYVSKIDDVKNAIIFASRLTPISICITN